MHQLIKFMIAVMLTVCLPLQGVAGVTMPACAEHDPVAQTVSAAGAADMISHCEHMKQSDAGKTDKTSHAKCYACYLSVAQAITPCALPAAPAGDAASYCHMVDSEYQTRLSPPFHPPKSTLALG